MEYIKISEIKENKTNPRTIKKEQLEKLKKSIKEFPKMLELRPLILDNNNVVLGWNMRLKALKELKYKDVPFIKADDLTEDQKKEFIIKDNVWFWEWDLELLEEDYNTDLLEDWGLDINFDTENIDFDNIKDNSDREVSDKTKIVECPACWEHFNI